MHIEEDVAAAIAVSLDGRFLCARHIQVIVGQPRLLLHVVHITDVMTWDGGGGINRNVKVGQAEWMDDSLLCDSNVRRVKFGSV